MSDNAVSRRAALQATAIGAVGMAVSPWLSLGAATTVKNRRVLFFTRSQEFPHAVVTRRTPEEPAFAEEHFKELGTAAGNDITVSKDGTLFNPDQISQWDAFAFYTTGDLTKPPGTRYKSDQTPAMTPEGKAALLKAVESGKGFLGLHSATDTFPSRDKSRVVRPDGSDEAIDPYIAMIGGEFTSHGSQQKATIRVARTTLPGLADLKDYDMTEEWYGLYNLAPDMHAILVQDTTTMKVDANGQREPQYRRDPYPNTWARRHGRGRVFYTSMGHREDVWTSPIFQMVLRSGLAWTTGNVEAEVSPNLEQVCPRLMKS